jgi:hypothetical protein
VPTFHDSVNTKSFLAAFTISDIQRPAEVGRITIWTRTKYNTNYKGHTLLDMGPGPA